jgi:hypothetical protein
MLANQDGLEAFFHQLLAGIARQVGCPVSDSKDGRSLRVEEDGVREAS